MSRADAAKLTGLAPSFRADIARLIAAARERGHAVVISDGLRSSATQAKAYRHWQRTGRNLAGKRVPTIAPPGRSLHERGLAVDLAASPEALRWMGAEWVRMGGAWGGHWKRTPEPWHFEARTSSPGKRGPTTSSRRVAGRSLPPKPARGPATRRGRVAVIRGGRLHSIARNYSHPATTRARVLAKSRRRRR